MAQNLVINSVTYNAVDSLSIPKSGGGNAVFPDTSDATAAAGDIADGKTAYVGGSKVTGTAPGGIPDHASTHASGGADAVTPASIGAAALDANDKVTPAQASARSVDVSASKTLALTDAGTRQRVVATSAITITVPPDSTVAWSDDTEIEILQIGAGLATIAPDTGVTLSSEGPATTSRTMSAQYTGAALVRTGSNAWVLIGALA